ncbi:uncharacterized protein LOC118611409 isoform X2 [Rousettus aegyptiacus]|uniref:uncharacterized protein LOC118611409 isoform X2 n=1 Tax=Rousettus aegyptiacus TaxID=9407 RepID=UPI00168D5AD2|nr:uncharacterized protein LOC118611409 isoform X2 [Rousettus aegyptiacus]
MASEALRAGSHGPEGARAVPTLRRPMSQHPDLRHQHPEEQQAALNKGPQEELSKSLFQATRSSCFHLPVSEGQNSVPTRGPGSFQQFLAHAMVPTCPSESLACPPPCVLMEAVSQPSGLLPTRNFQDLWLPRTLDIRMSVRIKRNRFRLKRTSISAVKTSTK